MEQNLVIFFEVCRWVCAEGRVPEQTWLCAARRLQMKRRFGAERRSLSHKWLCAARRLHVKRYCAERRSLSHQWQMPSPGQRKGDKRKLKKKEKRRKKSGQCAARAPPGRTTQDAALHPACTDRCLALGHSLEKISGPSIHEHSLP